MNKFIIMGLILTVAVSQALGENEDSFYGKQEPACLRRGGLCIVHYQCESPIGLQSELCPQNGYQCCSELPKDEFKCKSQGGECFKKGFCNQKIVYNEAADCKDDQDCCILM